MRMKGTHCTRSGVVQRTASHGAMMISCSIGRIIFFAKVNEHPEGSSFGACQPKIAFKAPPWLLFGSTRFMRIKEQQRKMKQFLMRLTNAGFSKAFSLWREIAEEKAEQAGPLLADHR